MGWRRQLVAVIAGAPLTFGDLLGAFILWLLRIFLGLLTVVALGWVPLMLLMSHYVAAAAFLAASLAAFILMAVSVWLRALMRERALRVVRRLHGQAADESFGE